MKEEEEMSNLEITDLWYEGKYEEVAQVIKQENWSTDRTIDFCLYFSKYVNKGDLQVLQKLCAL